MANFAILHWFGMNLAPRFNKLQTELKHLYCGPGGRLIANVVIAYNSILLTGLLGRHLTTGNEKALDLLRRISPVAWQHLGRYAFRGKRHPIDLESILAEVIWHLKDFVN